MLSQLENLGGSMKVVFRLEDRLSSDPKRIELAQALTLDPSRPRMGLRGVHGLFGSPEWWQSIYAKKMPRLELCGVVRRAYVAGQDSSEVNNTIDLLLEDGSVQMVGIYVNDVADAGLFVPGRKVAVLYARDELKHQPAADGGVNYLNIALEMAVSTE
jgi:hypothetical protein